MPKTFAPVAIAGAVSAALYVLVFTFGLGFLFLFLPTLPIFWLGLSRHNDAGLHACLAGLLLLAFISNPISAVGLYFCALALPAWYISHESLKHGVYAGRPVWFPLTVIFSRLMAACVFVLLAVTIYYAGDKGGLPGRVAPHISQAFHALSPEMDERTAGTIQMLAPSLSFLVFSVSAWMWAACLYLHGWVVTRELVRQKIAIRPELQVDAFPPPNWMISLALIAALASLIGGASLAFWGKASLIILLFPYFLLGMSLIHARTKKLEYRIALLFCLYFLLGALLWPVLLVAGYGFFYHIRLLNKYLSAGGTSSRS